MLPQSLSNVLSAINFIPGAFSNSASASRSNSQLQSLERIVQQTSALNEQVKPPSTSEPSVTGINSNQVSQVSVNSLGSEGGLSLQGSVLQAAKAASLTVVGGTGGVATSGGQYELSGNIGSTVLSFSQGESLADIASQLNQSTAATGVQASVQGNNLVLTSTLVGSNSTISFRPLDSSSNSISGVNSSQINSFQVQSQSPGATEEIAGSVTSSASQAQLVYQGTSEGTVAGTVSFQLKGSLGSTNLTITQGESLNSVANVINQATQSTGVVASVSGNQLNLNSETTGAAALVQINGVNPSQQVITSGVNNSQVSGVNVESIAPGSDQVLAGQVLQSATQASVTLQGSTSGAVINSAAFQLTGALGSTDISIQQGQSLASVADTVNAQTSLTGVVANVVANNLVFESTGVGSAANVGVQLTDISHSTVVSDVNSQQLSSFQTNSIATGASDTLSGEILQTASQASVTLQGSSTGTVVDSATFQLTGALGSTDVSIQQGQSLASVADAVNAQTTSTGIVANVVSNNLIFESTGVGSAANVGVQLTNISYSTNVSGVNSQQLSSFQTNSIANGASDTLSGQVVQSASQASVTLEGSSTGTVVDSATFQLSGALGSTNVSIQQGQSLASVAATVNAQTSSTGVVANVVSNNLVFESTGVGSAANVGVQLTNISYTTNVSGVNSGQVSSFQTNSITNGASDTLSGEVLQSATQASVTLEGSSTGTVVDSATFQLTGALGSTGVSIQQGQSLASVAATVNAQTSSTGVVANVVSNNLVFESTGIGSAANVGVQLTNISYTTNVSGVNSQQFSSFQTNSITNGASDTLSGQVVQSAAQASVTLQGSSSGTVVSSATFQLTGALGTTNISVQQGQSLASVASAVNALTSSTGVQASVNSNNLVFNSTGVGSAANVGVHLTNITYTTSVSGVNSQQLSSFQTNSITNGASDTLSGQVLQSATQASVTLQGSSSGTVVSSATFQLTGALGSTSVSIEQGQSLASVASAVNALTSSTGVQASVVSNNLVFDSTGVGSAANVGVQLTNITYTTSVSGVNSQQLSSFQVNSLTNGASESLSGNVTQTAGSAQLSYTGSLGFVATGSTFTLQGSQGSVQISTSALESLSSLVSQINSSSTTTGVQAVLSGNTVKFQSVGVGSSATVAVHVTSGSFGVSGGNGNGTANGTNAVATINGHSITGNGNSFQYTDSLGSYSFTTASGYTGAISSISVDSQAGQFNLTGGNGNGTANGTDAVAKINGQTITGVGNTFQYSDSVGSYSFTAASGFTGSLNPVSINSQAGQFNLTGGNGNGTANGTNAVAIINGQSITGDGNSFQFADGLGSYSFTTASGFTGAFNSINVDSQAGQFNLTGGNGNGTANGTDAVAKINGQTITGSGNTFQYADALGSYSFTTASGFAGSLNSININSQAGQFNLTGGNGNGTANGTNAVAVVNGQTITANGNSFHYADGLGSYSFTTASGFTGDFNPVSVDSQAGQFNLTGGNGDGTANGANAVAIVNGQTITGNGNSFQYSDGSGAYSFTSASGFTGAFDPVSIDSQAGQFSLTGGNGNGTAQGTDAIAIINGQTLTGTGNSFQISNGDGAFQIHFANGFEGGFDPITVQSQASAFNLEGGDGNGTAYGTNLVAVINGVQQSSQSNRTTFTSENGTYNISFAGGFVGQFSPITVLNNNGVATLGGNQNGVSYGSDVVANIDGQLITGDGGQVNYTENGINVSLNFAADFQGTFDPISVNQSDSVASDTTSTQSSSIDTPGSEGTNSEFANSATIQATLQIVENEATANLVLYQFSQAVSLLNELNAQSSNVSESFGQTSAEPTADAGSATDTTPSQTQPQDSTVVTAMNEQKRTNGSLVSILA